MPPYKHKDQIKCVRGMKEYECTTCEGVIDKGEEHIAHTKQGDDGWYTERFHRSVDCCGEEYAFMERGETIRE